MARKRSEKVEPGVEHPNHVEEDRTRREVEQPKAEPKKVEKKGDEQPKCTGLSGSGCDFQRVQLPFCKNARGGEEIGRLTFCYEHKLIIDQELKRVGVKQ